MNKKICPHCGSQVTTAQLPRRQQQVLAFFVDHLARYGTTPRIAEIGHALGIPTSTVSRAVDALVFKRKISRKNGHYTLPESG